PSSREVERRSDLRDIVDPESFGNGVEPCQAREGSEYERHHRKSPDGQGGEGKAGTSEKSTRRRFRRPRAPRRRRRAPAGGGEAPRKDRDRPGAPAAHTEPG